MPVQAILFDLDGTLVQTREAAWELFRQTDREFSLGIGNRDAFFRLFEDNFFRSLSRFCREEARAEAVKQHFLTLLRTQYCPALIPGMADVIHALASRCTLAVISTNAMQAIRRILTESGVAHCFAHVFAGDVEADKAVSIRRFVADHSYALGRHCTPAYDEAGGMREVSDGDVVLVTDTVGDVIEAGKCGIRAIGVAWGMHSEAKLLAAGAERVAIWPQELIAWLATEGTADEASSCRAGDRCRAEAAQQPSPAALSAGPCSCVMKGDGTQAVSAKAAADFDEHIDSRIEVAAEIRRQRRLKSSGPVAASVPVIAPDRKANDEALISAVRRTRAGSSIGVAPDASTGAGTVRRVGRASVPVPQAELLATLARMRKGTAEPSSVGA
jgi:phosphoglycolate phosphatase